MVQLRKDWENKPLVQYFMRHVVPISFDLRKQGERHLLVITAFAFSVYDRWLLMTAGHCITDIKRYRAAGYEIAACILQDGLGPTARHKIPVPFDYDAAEPTMLGAHRTWDYGVLFPSDNTRALLEANGVVPFSEESWERELESVETYRVLGIPAALTEPLGGDQLRVTMILPRVVKLEERPEGFEETTAPMFYGKLPTNPLTTLRGMSGGPILAFTAIDGNLRYFLCAMQVSAVGDYISGMLMGYLGRFLKEICEGRHDPETVSPAGDRS